MGKYNIQHSQIMPSGRVPGAVVDVDLRTGERQVAAAFTGLAEPIDALGQSIRSAEQALEFSDFKRQEEEHRNSAIEALDDPNFDVFNDEAVKALKTTADEDRNKFKSRYKKVNDAFEIHRDRVGPDWDKLYSDKVNQVKVKNLQDDFKLNTEDLLAKGKIVDYLTLSKDALDAGLISKTEHDYREKNAGNDSLLQQARVASVKQPHMVPYMLEALEDPNPDQLDYSAKLKKIALDQLTVNTNAAERDVIFGMYENSKMTLADKANLADEYIKQLNISGMTGSRFGTLVKRIQDWSEGTDTKTDWRVYSQALQRERLYRAGALTYEKMNGFISDNIGKLADSEIKSLYTRISGAEEQLETNWRGKAEKHLARLAGGGLDFQGFFRGTAKEEIRYGNALLMLDDEIKKAAGKGTPLTGQEIYVQAAVIGVTLMPEPKYGKDKEKLEPAGAYRKKVKKRKAGETIAEYEARLK